MIDPEIRRQLRIREQDVEADVAGILSAEEQATLPAPGSATPPKTFQVGSLLKGKVLQVTATHVILDLAYKTEGVVPIEEFRDASAVDVGDEVEVLLEAAEDDAGLLVVSKKRADRMRGWQRLVEERKEGDIVEGQIIKKIKGGLLVDVGFPVFLPASQVGLRRTADVAEFMGKTVQVKIIKIDKERRNVVVSRRKLLEVEREQKKKSLLDQIEVGQMLRGTVKNIADFGAFVDIGGIDGLLHVTDMSWGRVNHPSEAVKIDQELDVIVLNVDKERERIALGLKQKTPNPWEGVAGRYEVGARVKGKITNVVSYGAFVEVEPGVEGLIHVSEMSWTKRIANPAEILKIAQEVECQVLRVDPEKQTIALGMKQVEANPWTQVELKYPPGTRVDGTVRNLTNYGAFVEIEEGIDGLLHVSDMSWTSKVGHPSEILQKGDKVETVVLSIDAEKRRIALGRKQLLADPWDKEIPAKYTVGTVVSGKVTKLATFGAFVEIAPGLEGLLHLSEITDDPIDEPGQALTEGQEVRVMVIRVDAENRRLGLSLKQAQAIERAGG
ncbi:MAG: 30S ribosomal protein S1 [Planctomycetes bacterium]|nr:30S ribosomal protein S1 [Planctomycetota bacterium]